MTPSIPKNTPKAKQTKEKPGLKKQNCIEKTFPPGRTYYHQTFAIETRKQKQHTSPNPPSGPLTHLDGHSRVGGLVGQDPVALHIDEAAERPCGSTATTVALVDAESVGAAAGFVGVAVARDVAVSGRAQDSRVIRSNTTEALAAELSPEVRGVGAETGASLWFEFVSGKGGGGVVDELSGMLCARGWLEEG